MTSTDRGMGFGLRFLNRVASSDVLDRIGMRERVEKVVYSASKTGFSAAGAAGRTFSRVQRNGSDPARQKPGTRRDLFDLTPDDEQAMMREAIGDFAIEKLRPAALDADAACAAPTELLEQANELGITMLGVPEELGGAVAERSAVTSALVTEALGRGDMGLAVAALSPAAVVNRDRPLGRQRPAGDLPARVRRRQPPGRRARDPGAAPPLRPLRSLRPPRRARATASP